MNGSLRILSSMGHIAGRIPAGALPQWTALTVLRPLHALMAAPSLLLLATLTVMLFRPPGVELYPIDRIAFLLLVFVALVRALSMQQSLRVAGTVTWPMLGLVALTLSCVLAQPYAAQNWSLFAAKWQGLDWQRKKWGAFASLVLRLGERASLRLPSTTMVVSKNLQKHYQSRYFSRVTYVPNGTIIRRQRSISSPGTHSTMPDLPAESIARARVCRSIATG